MPFETITTERNDHIGIINLNRPQVRNALNRKMVEELLNTLEEFGNDDFIRVILIAGNGSSFCTGRDLADAREMAKEDVMKRRFYYRRMAQLMTKISQVAKPIVAAVQGYALAGGCGLAASCDLVIASEDAIFGVPEVKIGLVPGTVTAPLFRSVGRKKATEMLLTGDSIDAREACRIGLINKIVAREKLREDAVDLAQQIAHCSPEAIRIWKQAVSAQYDSEYIRLTDNFAEIVTLSSVTEDASEGLAAFLEKRKPKWQDP